MKKNVFVMSRIHRESARMLFINLLNEWKIW